MPILFSIPTVAEDGPFTSGADDSMPLDSDCVDIHEDEWRQVELVSASHLRAARSDLLEIQKIRDASTKHGIYREMLVRGSIPKPLDDRPFVLDQIRDVFTPVPRVRRLRVFSSTNQSVLHQDCFGLEIGDVLKIYGVRDDGYVHVCGAVATTFAGCEPGVRRTLGQFANGIGVALISWPTAQLFLPNDDGFSEMPLSVNADKPKPWWKVW